jgi:hypothetical protein
MDRQRWRLLLSLGTLAVWTAINVLAGRMVNNEASSSVADLLSHGIQPAFEASVLFLLVTLWLFRWSDLGLNAPFSARSLLVLLPPLTAVALILGGAFAVGLPPLAATIFILINTLLVGISEELMFRGILFKGLRSRLGIWPSIWLTSLLFGAIHLLNALWIGSFALALLQACTAFCTGMLLMAIRLRTKSLDPAILFHALWDFSLAMLTASPSTAGAAKPEVSGTVVVAAALFALVTLSYSLFLLRKATTVDAT